jgi:site-specific recombinase XerD
MDRPGDAGFDPYSTSQIQLRSTELEARTREFARRSIARSTERGYRSDWADFLEFCDEHGRQALPADPETVALYYAGLARAGARASTIGRRQAALKKAHQLAGLPSPTDDVRARAVMAGIRRELGVRPAQKAPLMTDLVRQLLEKIPSDTVAGLRDRALVLLGFSSGRRRSELVGLDVEDLREVPEGYRILIRRSKTDQEGRGQEIGIPYGQHSETCPVNALKAYLKASGLESGPLFRPANKKGELREGYRTEDGFWREWRMSPQSVALVIKHWISQAGLSPDDFAGHSLRAGLATQSAANGAPERAIMAQTGHTDVEMVRRYIRTGQLFHENAADFLGL